MTHQKRRLLATVAFFLIVGVGPVAAILIEHGSINGYHPRNWSFERAWLFIHSGPHLFFFGPLIAPFAFYCFLKPLVVFARAAFRSRAWIFLLLAMLGAGAACWADWNSGLPQLFELESEVQEQRLPDGGPTLWEFYQRPPTDPHAEIQRKQYTEKLRTLYSSGARSWVGVPYYIGMYALVLFGILLLVILAPAIRFGAERRYQRAVGQLFVASILCFPWLLAVSAFIQTKATIYGGDDFTAIILLMGVALASIVTTLYFRMEQQERAAHLIHCSFGAALLILVGASDTLPNALQVFSREHPAWRYMVYAFLGVFFFLPYFAHAPKKKTGPRSKP